MPSPSRPPATPKAVAYSTYWLAKFCPSLSATWVWAPFFSLLGRQHLQQTRW